MQRLTYRIYKSKDRLWRGSSTQNNINQNRDQKEEKHGKTVFNAIKRRHFVSKQLVLLNCSLAAKPWPSGTHIRW